MDVRYRWRSCRRALTYYTAVEAQLSTARMVRSTQDLCGLGLMANPSIYRLDHHLLQDIDLLYDFQ